MSNSRPVEDRAVLSFVPRAYDHLGRGIRVTRALFDASLWPQVLRGRDDVVGAYASVDQVPRRWRAELATWTQMADGTVWRCRPLVELTAREVGDLRDLAWYAVGADLLFEANETSALWHGLAATYAGIYPARRRAHRQALTPAACTPVEGLKLPRPGTALFAFEVDDNGLHIIGRASWLEVFEEALTVPPK